MVPTAFYLFERLPLNTSGKIDLDRLGDGVRMESEHKQGVAPRNAVEKALARCWKEVIGCEYVDSRSDYFEIGGDSILAINIVSLMRKSGYDLKVADFFKYTKLEELAMVCLERETIRGEEEALLESVPLTATQLCYLEESLGGEEGSSVLSKLYRWTGDFDLRIFKKAYSAIQRKFDVFKLRLNREEKCFSYNQSDFETDIEIVDLSASSEVDGRLKSHQSLLVDSLDIEKVATRLAVYYTKGGVFVQFAAHRLIMDEQSWAAFSSSLCEAYNQGIDGEIDIGKTSVSFGEWCMRLAMEQRRLGSSCAGGEGLASPDFPALKFPLAEEAIEDDVGAVLLKKRRWSIGPREEIPYLKESIALKGINSKELVLASLWTAVDVSTRGRSCTVWCEDFRRTGSEGFDDDSCENLGLFARRYPLSLDSSNKKQNLLLQAKQSLKSVCGDWRSDDSIGESDLLIRFDSDIESVDASRLMIPVEDEDPGFLNASRHGSHPVVVTCIDRDSTVDITVSYDAAKVSVNFAEELIDEFRCQLFKLHEQCLSVPVALNVPADFPMADIGWEDLAALTSDLGSVESVYPLSSVQRMFLAHSSGSGRDEGIVQQGVRLKASGELSRLVNAWKVLWNSTPVLRTVIRQRGSGKILQVVRNDVPLPLEELDWSDQSEDLQAQRLADFNRLNRERGFDLEEGPLMRISIIRLSDDAAEMIFAIHHIICDGLSAGFLMQDLLRLYKENAGDASMLERKGSSFENYVAWLEQRDGDAVSQAFWRNRLEGLSSSTRVPYDRSADLLCAEKHTESFDLSKEVSDNIREFAATNGYSMNVVCLGAWAITLKWLSGNPDILFGIAVSGRNLLPEELDGVIGPLNTTLPFRVYIDKEDTFNSLLGRTRALQGELMEYDHCSVSDIHDSSSFLGNAALFESLVVFEDQTRSIEGLTDFVEYSDRSTDSIVADFPLSLLPRLGERLGAALQVDRSRYEVKMGRNILRKYVSILSELSSRPLVPLVGTWSELNFRPDLAELEESLRDESEGRIESGKNSIDAFRTLWMECDVDKESPIIQYRQEVAYAPSDFFYRVNGVMWALRDCDKVVYRPKDRIEDAIALLAMLGSCKEALIVANFENEETLSIDIDGFVELAFDGDCDSVVLKGCGEARGVDLGDFPKNYFEGNLVFGGRFAYVSSACSEQNIRWMRSEYLLQEADYIRRTNEISSDDRILSNFSFRQPAAFVCLLAAIGADAAICITGSENQVEALETMFDSSASNIYCDVPHRFRKLCAHLRRENRSIDLGDRGILL
ncbi:MAG: hypothetical protein F6K21_24375 [Symploca sp. SIO2D2]|nr:hypothetical protein [Symploca sp. SIO2D2]